MNKWSVVLVVSLVICLLVTLGCGSKPATPQTHEKVDILILGGTGGGAAYIKCAGLAEIINKHHPWLRATVMETFGSSDNIKKFETNPNSFGIVSDVTYWTALEGGKPFEKKQTHVRNLALSALTGVALVTIDPKIKTKQDLVGKKISVGARGSSISQSSELLLGDIWGMWDKIDPQYTEWKAGGEAIKDGLIHAMTVVINLATDDSGKVIWVAHPSFSEIMSLRDVYFIGPTEKEVQDAAKKKGWPLSYLHLPAQALGPRQKEAAGTFSLANNHMCGASMTEEVAYEITKVHLDYYKEWWTYHAGAKIISPDTLAFAPVLTENEFHPGALKLYKEKGVKIYYGGKSPPLQ